jgi:hypothetical protein
VDSTFEIETQVGNRIFPVTYGNLPPQLENQLLTLVNRDNGIVGYDFLKRYRVSLNAALNELKIADSIPLKKNEPFEPHNPFNPGPGIDPNPKHDFLLFGPKA